MKIQAVIFDLDDTLFDQTTQVTPAALAAVAEALGRQRLDTPNNLREKMRAITTPHFAVLLDELLESYELAAIKKAELRTIGRGAYLQEEHLHGIVPFPETADLLAELKNHVKLCLVTTGDPSFQGKKVELLGLADYFDIIIIDTNPSKEEKFLKILRSLNLKPRQVLCVGDRIDNEIKSANKLGMITARLLHGKYSVLTPKNQLEIPDYEIKTLGDVATLLEHTDREIYLKKGPKIVAIGGGTGMPMLLQGIKHYSKNITAIVTMTDSGRSSGTLRKELGMLPPGDIRNNLVALSDAEDLLLKLFNYRFTEGNLEGQSLGNLLIAGLTKMTGSFEQAIIEASKILNVSGKVYPATLDDINICVRREDGTVSESEDQVVQRFEHDKKPSRITDAYLQPTHPEAYAPAVQAILDADFIIIGPGSLYTSIITNLLIPGIAEALRTTKAVKLYVCNIVTQPYQTDIFTASDHLKSVQSACGAKIDYCLLNVRSPDLHVLHQYEQQKSFLVKVDLEEIERLGTSPILADLLGDIPTGTAVTRFWHKRDLLRHDPQKLAGQIISLVDTTFINNGNVEKHE